MSLTQRFKYNQQVAADIQYQLRPNSTHDALKNATIFNLLAITPSTTIVKRRPWFGFDRDVRMNDIETPIIHERDDLIDMIERFEAGESLNPFETPIFDDETVRMFLETVKEDRNFSLHFDVEMSQEEITHHITENLHFERLSKLVERISRALKNDERGALLRLDVSFTPAFGFD